MKISSLFLFLLVAFLGAAAISVGMSNSEELLNIRFADFKNEVHLIELAAGAGVLYAISFFVERWRAKTLKRRAVHNRVCEADNWADRHSGLKRK